ncbi:MAG: hypothetical protein D3906_11580 [Candidatus Electrothrix sp. AUS1_2]|nr:hypothetical protein [Candidatus Electrothrix sp. AUS1_2]
MFILHLNFSVIEACSTIGAVERSFNVHCKHRMRYMRNKYALLKDMPDIDTDEPVSDCLKTKKIKRQFFSDQINK